MDQSQNGDHASQHEGDEERKMVRQGYRKLMDKLAVDEEQLANIDNHHLIGYMEENQELFGKVCAPQEAVLDAKVIRHISRICRQQAEGMSANITQFQYNEYAERLLQCMRGSISGDGAGVLTKKKWVLLGRQAKTLFRRSPCLTYMYGALDNAPPPPKERKAPQARANVTKIKDLVETQEQILETAEKSENQTEQLVTHVITTLIAKWHENEKRSVDFFKFVIDPECFGNTVENMFHVSFLIKDGRVAFKIGENGLPVIRPKSTKKAEGQPKEEAKNQVVMNISMKDWQLMVQNLNITEAMIPHIKAKQEPNGDQASQFKKPKTKR